MIDVNGVNGVNGVIDVEEFVDVDAGYYQHSYRNRRMVCTVPRW